MPRFQDLPDDFRCPHRDGCPYLEGLPTGWVFHRYQEVVGTECHYEYQLGELHKQLDEERRQGEQIELENQKLRAQLRALHRRQFKGRCAAAVAAATCPSTERKKRGAPLGHQYRRLVVRRLLLAAGHVLFFHLAEFRHFCLSRQGREYECSFILQ